MALEMHSTDTTKKLRSISEHCETSCWSAEIRSGREKITRLKRGHCPGSPSREWPTINGASCGYAVGKRHRGTTQKLSASKAMHR